MSNIFPLKCQSCTSGETVKAYCKFEKKFICVICINDHDELREHRSHELVKIPAQYQVDGQTETTIFQYCKVCLEFDLEGKHKRRGHSVGSLVEYRLIYCNTLKRSIEICMIVGDYIQMQDAQWNDNVTASELNRRFITELKRSYASITSLAHSHMIRLLQYGKNIEGSGSFPLLLWEVPHFENAVYEAANVYLRCTPYKTIEALIQHHDENRLLLYGPSGNDSRQGVRTMSRVYSRATGSSLLPEMQEGHADTAHAEYQSHGASAFDVIVPSASGHQDQRGRGTQRRRTEGENEFVSNNIDGLLSDNRNPIRQPSDSDWACENALHEEGINLQRPFVVDDLPIVRNERQDAENTLEEATEHTPSPIDIHLMSNTS